MIKFYTLIFGLIVLQQVFAQNYVYEQFDVNDGLPSSQVFDFHQDKNGYLWIATDRGLARFNGYEFETFGIEEGLPEVAILDFFPQANGNIWFTTIYNELFYFNDDFEGFTPYKYNAVLKSNINSDLNRVESIYINSLNQMHFGFAGGNDLVLLKISEKGEVLKRANGLAYANNAALRLNCSIYENNIPFVYFDFGEGMAKKNTFSFQTDSYALLEAAYLSKNKRCAFINEQNENEFVIIDEEGVVIKKVRPPSKTLNIVALDDSKFMIGYHGEGAEIIDDEGTVLSHILPHESITSGFIDREGGYWFSTVNSGIYYIRNFNLQLCNIPNNDSSINSLAKSKSNELFVGYSNGDIIKLNNEKNFKSVYKSQSNTKALVEYSEQRNHLLLYSDSIFISNQDRLTFVSSEYTRKISEESSDGIFISYTNGFFKITHKDSISLIRTPFRTLDAMPAHDKIYLASIFGLHSYKNGAFTSEKTRSKLLDVGIEDLDYNHCKDEIYLATLGKGLVIISKDSTYNITTKEGLQSNIINEVHIENETEIWLATNNGVNKVKFNNDGAYTIFGLDHSDGLLSNEVQDIEILNDTVFIATKKGLMQVSKSNFSKRNELENILFSIKSIVLNDSTYTTKEKNSFSYKENALDFNLEGISFKYKDRLRYYYMLEGLSNTWQSTVNRRVRFLSLPPGSYNFKAKVCIDKNNCYSQVIDFPFSISPPFWKTGWFYTLILLGFGLLIYWFFKIKILLYNRDVTRELIRFLIKKMSPDKNYILFREAGQDVRISSLDIIYVKSSGNYIDIMTQNKKFTIREKIGDFISLPPDPLEYIQIHRSYIIRLDAVTSKSSNKVILKTGIALPVGKKYLPQLNKIVY